MTDRPTRQPGGDRGAASVGVHPDAARPRTVDQHDHAPGTRGGSVLPTPVPGGCIDRLVDADSARRGTDAPGGTPGAGGPAVTAGAVGSVEAPKGAEVADGRPTAERSAAACREVLRWSFAEYLEAIERSQG